MKTAAPLPLKAGTSVSKGLNKILDADGHVIGEASNYAVDCFNHRDYLIHAANAYPKLVDAVRRMPQLAFEPSNNGERWDEGYKAGFFAAMERAFAISQSLLRELGEEA